MEHDPQSTTVCIWNLGTDDQQYDRDRVENDEDASLRGNEESNVDESQEQTEVEVEKFKRKQRHRRNVTQRRS